MTRRNVSAERVPVDTEVYGYEDVDKADGDSG